MNPAFLPRLGAALRKLGAYPDQHDVNDATLAELAAELDRARALLAVARGLTANSCPRHPGGPVDPAEGGACLLCRTPRQPEPREPAATARSPAEVLAAIEEHGPEAATRRYGGHAVTRALALGHTRQNKPNPTDDNEPQENR